MKDTWSKTPHWLMAKATAGEVPWNAVILFAVLAKFANRRGRGVWPSNRTLMAETGFSERTIQNHKRALEAIGATQTAARHTASGRQTSNLVILLFDEPEEAAAPPPQPVAPPPQAQPVAPSPPQPVAPSLEPDQEGTTEPPPHSSAAAPPTEVGGSTHLSSDSPPASPVPNTGSSVRPGPLPLVRRRQLMNAGVTPEQAPLWEQAWDTVTSMLWPEWAQMEALNYPDEHLAQHIFQTLERGYTLSPSRWVQFYISDRQLQLVHLRGRLDQEARMAEDPAEREARQNRSLPPDRSREYPAAGAEA